jgi:hypothetical protein
LIAGKAQLLACPTATHFSSGSYITAKEVSKIPADNLTG